MTTVYNSASQERLLLHLINLKITELMVNHGIESARTKWKFQSSDFLYHLVDRGEAMELMLFPNRDDYSVYEIATVVITCSRLRLLYKGRVYTTPLE